MLTPALVLILTLPFSRFVAAAHNKYLNMVASKEYNKVDLRKQELLALATKIEGLEAQLSRQNTALATSGGDGGGTNAASGLNRNLITGTSIVRWRVTKQGVSITIDGKTYWWCEKHVDPADRSRRTSLRIMTLWWPGAAVSARSAVKIPTTRMTSLPGATGNQSAAQGGPLQQAYGRRRGRR